MKTGNGRRALIEKSTDIYGKAAPGTDESGVVGNGGQLRAILVVDGGAASEVSY